MGRNPVWGISDGAPYAYSDTSAWSVAAYFRYGRQRGDVNVGLPHIGDFGLHWH